MKVDEYVSAQQNAGSVSSLEGTFRDDGADDSINLPCPEVCIAAGRLRLRCCYRLERGLWDSNMFCLEALTVRR